MQLLFLGTSAGMPTIQRNVTAIAIKLASAKSWCLVDCGEGTQHQLLKAPLSLVNLQTIFITHVHGDHCYGLPGLLASATMAGRTAPLTIVGPADIETFVTTTLRTTQMGSTYDIHFIDVETLTDEHTLGDFDVSVTALSHRVPSYAYSFREPITQAKLDTDKLRRDKVPSGPLWGALQQGEDVTLDDGRKLEHTTYLLAPRARRKLIIAGDNDQPELLTKSACDANVLVHEATYTQAISIKVGSGPQHSSAQQTAQFAQACGVDNLVLTHFSARYHKSKAPDIGLIEIEKEAAGFYKGNLLLADDFDILQLSLDGCLSKVGSAIAESK